MKHGLKVSYQFEGYFNPKNKTVLYLKASIICKQKHGLTKPRQSSFLSAAFLFDGLWDDNAILTLNP